MGIAVRKAEIQANTCSYRARRTSRNSASTRRAAFTGSGPMTSHSEVKLFENHMFSDDQKLGPASQRINYLRVAESWGFLNDCSAAAFMSNAGHEFPSAERK